MRERASRERASAAAGWRGAALAAVLALALALPFVVGGFTVYQFTLAGIYAIAVLGLGLLTGTGGQISLGHGTFFTLGAYTMAIATGRWGISAYAALPLAGLVAFAAGYLVGLPAARLKFLQLALATYGLALVLPQVLKSSHLEAFTGGVQGLYLERPGAPAGLPLSDDQWWYLVTLAVLALMLWTAANLIRSRAGRAMMALRDHPLAAASLGIDVGRQKALTFAISALYTGIAGALAALRMDFVAPDSFALGFSLLLLIGLVVGGAGSIWGAVVGGLLIQFLPSAAALVSADLTYAVFGAIVILVLWLAPQGIAGLAARLLPRGG